MTGPGYHYNCPSCNNVTLERNASMCGHCRTALVWSPDPTDQPRQHPHGAAADLGQGTLYALAGEPIVENKHGVPALDETIRRLQEHRDDLEKKATELLHEASARALPPGEQAVDAGEAYELTPQPVSPSEQSPASAASGVQEVEAPASALDKPDSLPGHSKPEIERRNRGERNIVGLPTPPEGKEKQVPELPETEEIVGLPEPPEGQEKQVPELLKAVDLTGAASTLPDDPNPLAPLSGLHASEIAVIAHAANLAYRTILGDEPGPGWLDMDPAEQESVIAGVCAVLAGSVNGPAYSHKAWYDRKLSEGWVYGTVKDVEAKIHPNMIAHGVWGDLPDDERRKDLLFLAVVVSLIRHV